MQFTVLALAGFAAMVSAQTYTGKTVSPTAPAPAGCTGTYNGNFQISVANSSQPSKMKRQSEQPGNAALLMLKDGILSDGMGRIGYIASNDQFQFDYGGQAGEIYTAGFSICPNNSLALGGSAVWWECLSGSFYNLYDKTQGMQCKECLIDIIPSDSTQPGSATVSGATSSASSASSAATSAMSSAAAGSVSTSVAAVSSSAAAVTSLGDGQVQGPTSTSVVVSMSTTLITQSPVMSSTSVAVVTSITDHQIQAPTKTSVLAYSGNGASMPTVAAQMILAAAGAAVYML